MSNNDLKNRYKGSKFTVVHCEGALDSFDKALNGMPAKKQVSFRQSMMIQIERLANGVRMSNHNFPQEGGLPKRVGQHRAKKFNALKKIPIRGYCWLSETHENTYFISHYIHKKKGKLNKSDISQVGKNWTRIEVDGDER